MKYIIQDKDYLQHHGIKGQKWGVENGPPYPLSQRDYSALEKKMNNIKSMKSASENARSNLKAVYSNSVGGAGGADKIRKALHYQFSNDEKLRSSVRDARRYVAKLKKSGAYKNAESRKALNQIKESIEQIISQVPHLPVNAYVLGANGNAFLNPFENAAANKYFNDPKFIKEFEDYLYNGNGDKRGWTTKHLKNY